MLGCTIIRKYKISHTAYIMKIFRLLSKTLKPPPNSSVDTPLQSKAKQSEELLVFTILAFKCVIFFRMFFFVWFRLYFMNKTNFWCWFIPKNEKPKNFGKCSFNGINFRTLLQEEKKLISLHKILLIELQCFFRIHEVFCLLWRIWLLFFE